MVKANSKMKKICAFCAQWYDPSNSHIFPCKPYDGFHWEIDEKAMSPCFKKMVDTNAEHYCTQYVPKKLF